MIGIINKDSSFFTINSKDTTLQYVDIAKDLISLSITERLGSMPQGSLKLHDPFHLYSRIFRTGMEIQLSWGYKNFNVLAGFVDSDLNLDEFNGDIERRGLKGIITSPTGGGDGSGVVTYNCNFTSYGFRGEDKTFIYDTGTRSGVISQAFSDLGILPTNMIIEFAMGNDSLSSVKSVRQDETTFLFLTRLAREWRTLFTIGYNKKGLPVGIFVDPEKINKMRISNIMLGLSGSSHNIGYKGKLCNVKSYTWSSNESQNGVGDNVRIDIIDGQPVFRRFIAEEETIVTYKLNTKRIEEAFKDKEIDGIAAQTKLVTEMLSAKSFEQVKHYFDPYESTTAPQGFGYKIKVDMIGNPAYSPPNQIRLYNGFPDRLGGKQAIYYLNEVTHSIDTSGYNMSCEIVDVFAFSDIGQGLI